MANDKIEKDTITCSAAMSECEKPNAKPRPKTRMRTNKAQRKPQPSAENEANLLLAGLGLDDFWEIFED